jgi:proliferating cell nuclear antigen
MGKIFHIITENVSQIRTLFEVLGGILQDAVIEIIKPIDKNDKNDKKDKKKSKKESISNTSRGGGLKILMTSGDTILIYLKLSHDKFVKFSCEPSKYNIDINLQELNKMLKSTDKEDKLEMYVDDDEQQFLVLSVENSEIKRNTEFKLKLMDIEPSCVNLPPVEPDVMITINASEFHKLCKDMTQIGALLEIQCTSNTLIFKCEGKNSSRETTYTVNEDGVKIAFTCPNKQLIAQGIYELRHLNLFSKCSSLSGEVQLLMKVKSYPLCIKYTVGTLGEFIVCIAPIENKESSTYDDGDDPFKDEIIELKQMDKESEE